jgi:RND superfamily putative drug exporter
MAVAFLGLLPSHEGNLQQISFIISVAVLCDTFLVRGLMIPCMMSILGKWNWWPRRM